MFKKVEENISMLRRNMKNIKIELLQLKKMTEMTDVLYAINRSLETEEK